MDILDIVFLALLCCLIVFAIRLRHRRAIRLVAAAGLALTTCFCIFSLDAFCPRLAVSLREHDTGRLSDDFREGVLAVTRVSRPCYPYILISSIGLALLAGLGGGRKKDDG